MELTPQILIVVLPLIFLGGFVDSVAGGGGLITLPAYLMAGIPAHLAMGTNKVVNGTGTALASFKYFRGGKVLLRPAIISGIGALLGAAIGTKIALLINEDILKIMMLVALPCAAILLMLKKDFGKENDAPAREYTPQQELTRAALIGLGLGCYDGLIGPGTGTFMIMAFTMALSMDLLTASGLREDRKPLLQRRLGGAVHLQRQGLVAAGAPRGGLQYAGRLLRRALRHEGWQQARARHDLCRAGASLHQDGLRAAVLKRRILYKKADSQGCPLFSVLQAVQRRGNSAAARNELRARIRVDRLHRCRAEKSAELHRVAHLAAGRRDDAHRSRLRVDHADGRLIGR